MPKEGKAWGTYGNKPKQDNSTGEWIEGVKCSIDFPEGTKTEDIKFNNQKVYIYTEEEHKEVLRGGGGELSKVQVYEAMISLLETWSIELTEKRNEAIKEVTPIPEEG